MYELFVKSAQKEVECRGTAFSEHGRTLFAPTDVCGVIKGCEINNNAKCQGGVGCRGRQPLHLIAMVCYAAKSLRSVLFFTLCLFFSLVSFPHSSLLIPHSSLLTPHSSFLTPHSSFLIPHSSFLTPHSSFLIPHSSLKSLYRLTKPL